jgi:hypothetical protein
MHQIRDNEHGAEDKYREEPAALEVKDCKRREGRVA